MKITPKSKDNKNSFGLFPLILCIILLFLPRSVITFLISLFLPFPHSPCFFLLLHLLLLLLTCTSPRRSHVSLTARLHSRNAPTVSLFLLILTNTSYIQSTFLVFAVWMGEEWWFGLTCISVIFSEVELLFILSLSHLGFPFCEFSFTGLLFIIFWLLVCFLLFYPFMHSSIHLSFLIGGILAVPDGNLLAG